MPEGATIDSYFGGVYIQVNYTNEGSEDDISYTYSLPVDCSEMFQHLDPISE